MCRTKELYDVLSFACRVQRVRLLLDWQLGLVTFMVVTQRNVSVAALHQMSHQKFGKATALCFRASKTKGIWRVVLENNGRGRPVSGREPSVAFLI